MKEELYLDRLACGLLYDEVCVKPLGKEEFLNLTKLIIKTVGQLNRLQQYGKIIIKFISPTNYNYMTILFTH